MNAKETKIAKRKRSLTNEDVEEEVIQNFVKLEADNHHEFWFNSTEAAGYLNTNPLLRDIKIAGYLPKSVFLVRLLKPICSKDYDLRMICRKRLNQLNGLQKPLDPASPEAANILQDLRAALNHSICNFDIMLRLKSEDEHESSLDPAESKVLEASSLRSLLMRCIAFEKDIPSKEEALYLIAAIAMNRKDAFKFTDTLVLDEILKAVERCHASLNEYYVERQKVREDYERLQVYAKFAKKKVYVPPRCPVIKYRHKGSGRSHCMRSLTLYTATIMLHHWRRPYLVETILTNCLKHRSYTRLVLLRLLQVSLRNWSVYDKQFSDVTHGLVKTLWETRLTVGEFRESQELMGFCFQKIRSLLGRSSGILTHHIQILNPGGNLVSSSMRKKKIMTSSLSSKRIGAHQSKMAISPMLPAIN